TWWSRWFLARRFRLGLASTRFRPNTEATLLLVFDETRQHQLHQTREVTVGEPVTGEGTRALDQIEELRVSGEVHAKAIRRERLEFTTARTRMRGRDCRLRRWGYAITGNSRHFWGNG